MLRRVLCSILLALLLPVLVLSQDPPLVDPPIAPPAGRALLSRGADLEPYDFPPSVDDASHSQLHRNGHDPILGPPGFWTEPSLRAHYLSHRQFRYHPRLYPTPPPFEIWLKEQQLIRAINLHSHSLAIDLERPGLTKEELLQHEMLRGELAVLLRLLQISTSLKYASLSPEWRKFEESMYRHWAGFLEVSQREKQKLFEGEHLDRHLNWVQQLAKEESEEEHHSQAAAGGIAGGRSGAFHAAGVGSSSENVRTAEELYQTFAKNLHL